MKLVEKNLMTGMISILRQAMESKQRGAPIMDDECFNIRLDDLKHLEDETGVMFINSPNCKIDLESIIDIKKEDKDNLKECQSAEEITECFNQKEMIAYLDIAGSNIIATYTNGYLTNIQTNDVNVKKEIQYLNLPYNINKDSVYVIEGKIALAEKPTFYANDILKGGSGNLRNDLSQAKELNFDTVPFWCTNNLNSKKLEDAIDYVINYMTDDDLKYDGIAFKFNEKKFSNALNFAGCHWSKTQ